MYNYIVSFCTGETKGYGIKWFATRKAALQFATRQYHKNGLDLFSFAIVVEIATNKVVRVYPDFIDRDMHKPAPQPFHN